MADGHLCQIQLLRGFTRRFTMQRNELEGVFGAMSSHKGIAFDWPDPFLLRDQLTEEERLVQETAAAYAAEHLAPRVEKAYLDEFTDPQIFAEMGECGLLGATVPEAYGG